MTAFYYRRCPGARCLNGRIHSTCWENGRPWDDWKPCPTCKGTGRIECRKPTKKKRSARK